MKDNELILCEPDLTMAELEKLQGAKTDSLIGFRNELFTVVSTKPLKLLLVQNAGIANCVKN